MSEAIVGTEPPSKDQPTDHADSLSADMTDNEKLDTSPTPSPPPAPDWDGPGDPDNPHNWPLWLRVYHATTPGLFGFAV